MISLDKINSEVNRYVGDLQSRIDKARSIKGFIPVFETAYYIQMCDGSLHIDFPWNDGFSKVMEQAEDNGWVLGSEYEMPESGSHAYIYVHEECRFRLWLEKNASASGSTCKRVKIGTREIPVYTVDCDHQVEFMEE